MLGRATFQVAISAFQPRCAQRNPLLLILTAALLSAADRYPVTGIVLRVDPAHRSFIASCAAIPG